ncbi:MAG: UDP-N-acetylglucosamine 1-carboxyvinyltransferase [Candidatus Thorarchaeota archaeon]
MSRNKELIIHAQDEIEGDVSIGGSKNATLPCCAASLLSDEIVTLSNVPDVSDILTMNQILQELGVSLKYNDKVLTITNASIESRELPLISQRIRGSTILMGALLAKYGEVIIHGYGGCAIGSRPIDLHLNAFKALGANVIETPEKTIVRADQLKGTKITFPVPSVGATENTILAACGAEGTTLIKNAAIEPEVSNMITLLRQMGMDVSLNSTYREVIIHGGLSTSGVKHKIIPDRIEAGTYAIIGAIAKGELTLHDIVATHLESLFGMLEQIGVEIEYLDSNTARIVSDGNTLRNTMVSTAPYPGFPTDLQAQTTTLLTQCNGTSKIRESIFEDRFKHVTQLNKMGASIEMHGDTLVIEGRKQLKGVSVKASELRGGMSLVIAGLVASGTTIVQGFEHIERGYECLPQKLLNIGASIEVIEH